MEAKITVDIKVSKAGTGISPDLNSAFLHLTRNAGPMIAGDTTASDVDLSAINIQASVDVHLSRGDHPKPGDDSNLKFGFIQLVDQMQRYTGYAGRTSNDGYIPIDLAGSTAFPKEFAYDYVLDSAQRFLERMSCLLPTRGSKSSSRR
jgi:hypothetical protein